MATTANSWIELIFLATGSCDLLQANKKTWHLMPSTFTCLLTLKLHYLTPLRHGFECREIITCHS